MITYFNLYQPEKEKLMAEDEYRKSELFDSPVFCGHPSGSRPTGPLSLSLKHNQRNEMMIWSWGFSFVVHEGILAEFATQGFTGYRTKPASVRFRDGSVSTEYHEFLVTGWAGMASAESGVRVVESCPACPRKYYSPITNYEKLIDWSNWTGDDFFMLWPLPGFKLITERVAFWLLSSGVRSFRLAGLDERLQGQRVPSSGFTPGRLLEVLPEDLAIKYGRPLGID